MNLLTNAADAKLEFRRRLYSAASDLPSTRLLAIYARTYWQAPKRQRAKSDYLVQITWRDCASRATGVLGTIDAVIAEDVLASLLIDLQQLRKRERRKAA